MVNSITSSDLFYCEVVDYFNSKIICHQTDLINLSRLLRIIIKASIAKKNPLDHDQAKNIELMIIQTGLIELCTGKFIWLINKNNVVSSAFLCAFKLLEYFEECLYRRYIVKLVNQRDELKLLKKHLPRIFRETNIEEMESLSAKRRSQKY